MARLRGIQVLVQQASPQKTWSSLKETDLEDSVKDTANSATRWSTGVEGSPGPFRFLVAVEEGFEWKGANGLEIVLTFDNGYLLNDYRTLAIRPENASPDMDQDLAVHPMSPRPQDGCLQLELSNVVLPWPEDLSRSEYRQAGFSFETLNRTQIAIGNDSKRRESFSEMGMLKVQVAPVFIRTLNKVTRIAHNSNSDYQAYENALTKVKLGVTLKAELQWDINPVQGACAYSGKSDNTKKRTFVFFYREAKMYVEVPQSKIEVQDEDGKTAGRPKASVTSAYVDTKGWGSISPSSPRPVLRKSRSIVTYNTSSEAQSPKPGLGEYDEPGETTSRGGHQRRPPRSCQSPQSERSLLPITTWTYTPGEPMTPEHGPYSRIHEILRTFEIESARNHIEKEQLIVKKLEGRNAEIQSEQQKLQEQKDELVRRKNALKTELEQNNNRIGIARARPQDVQGGRPSVSVDEVERVFQILRDERQREAEEELREVEDNVEKARKRRRSALSAGDSSSDHRDIERFEGRSHKPGN